MSDYRIKLFHWFSVSRNIKIPRFDIVKDYEIVINMYYTKITLNRIKCKSLKFVKKRSLYRCILLCVISMNHKGAMNAVFSIFNDLISTS